MSKNDLRGSLMLFHLFLLLSCSLGFALILRKFHIPIFGAFLLTGFLAKKYNILEAFNVECLSKIGVLLLLFTVGLELSFKGVASLKKFFFLSLVIILTTFSISFGFLSHFFTWFVALIISAAISFSSTAIVMHFLVETKQLHSHVGKLSVTLLILQDILAVFILSIINPDQISNLPVGIFIFGLFFVVFNLFINNFLHKIYSYHKESFFLTIFIFILSFCLMGESIGLSSEIGAMCAGMILANSKFVIKIESSIAVIKEIFLMFFFIEIGSNLKTEILLQNYQIVILGVVGIIITKILGTIIGGFFSINKKNLFIVSLISCNISEISFLLIQELFEHKFLNQVESEIILLIFILLTFSSPVFALIAKSIENNLIRKIPKDKNFEIIIVGINPYSEKILQEFEKLQVSYLAIDESIEKVAHIRSLGHKAYLGNFFKINENHYVTECSTLIFASNVHEKVDRIIEFKELHDETNIFVFSQDKKLSELLESHGVSCIEIFPKDLADEIINQILASTIHEKIEHEELGK